jgi:hypothetical protein
MATQISRFLLGAGLVMAGIGPAFAAGSSMHSQESQRTEAIKYFLAHLLGFAPIFNLYHHSPGWILRRRKQLEVRQEPLAVDVQHPLYVPLISSRLMIFKETLG